MDLADALRVLRRRILPIAICIIAGVVGGVGITVTSATTYLASSRLFVNIPAAQGVQESLQGVELSSTLLLSYTRIVTSRDIAEKVSARLDRRFTPAQVRARVSAVRQRSTLLIDVVAVDVEPVGARDIANAAAQALIEQIAQLEANKSNPVEARIIDPAVSPVTPISPKRTRNVELGLLLGLAAGVALAFVLESLDGSVTTSEQASTAIGAPTLASLPRQRGLEAAPLVAMETAAHGGESYRSLRTAVRFLATTERLTTMVVSSPGAGDGKTTVAANLAVSIAQSGERVIVIDADLRKPRLASLFGMGRGKGLTDVVYGRATLEDALQPWRDGLLVLSGGALPSNPSEVLGSEPMAHLIEDAAKLADVVIIDAPPVLAVTDAAVLSAFTDGVLVVARWGVTELDALEEARFVFDGAGARVTGVVLNGVAGQRSPAYYRGYRTGPVASAAGR